MSLSHFDEKSGVVAVSTSWGKWWQAVSEVFIEVNIPNGTPGKDCQVTIRSNYVECRVLGEEIFKGTLFRTIHPDNSTWTVEERSKIVILLEKTEKFHKENSWVSLLTDQYVADPLVQHEMLKKLDLEKFQIEHPGFDFSGAELKKSYETPPFVPDS